MSDLRNALAEVIESIDSSRFDDGLGDARKNDAYAFCVGYGRAILAALDERDALAAELERLRGVIRDARAYVVDASNGEHLLDGFGPRSAQPSDELLRRIDIILPESAGGAG